MKTIQTILLSLFILCPVVVAATAPGGAQGADPDMRTPLLLNAEERHLVLSEMRGFVSAIDQILEGITREEMQQIASVARTVGSSAANAVPASVMAKLPDDFKVFASRVHGTFDLIALDAESLGDTSHTIEQLAGLTKNCIACHALYQIKSPTP